VDQSSFAKGGRTPAASSGDADRGQGGACEDVGDAPGAAARRWVYVRFIGGSILVVLAFALFQHLVVLGIRPAELRPQLLVVPAVVGAVFGLLLAKVRILHLRSRCQLQLILERDRRLEREIQERKRVETSLREQRRQLTLSNDELRSFSYSVSHDLRTPLRAVSGFSQTLDEEYGLSLDDKGRDYLARIRNGCQRMEAMIDSLMLLARVSQADLLREPVNLSLIARDILNEFSDREPNRKVELDVEPDLVAVGDRRLLTLAMQNLLANAWKFTARQPAARIAFRHRDQEADRAYCVEDNGVGFDMKYAAKLFAPFGRLHREEQFPGSGIGLATVQRAIARHGGQIWADGQPGLGARFCFTL
jgi:signal transduction histidine kinase